MDIGCMLGPFVLYNYLRLTVYLVQIGAEMTRPIPFGFKFW